MRGWTGHLSKLNATICSLNQQFYPLVNLRTKNYGKSQCFNRFNYQWGIFAILVYQRVPYYRTISSRNSGILFRHAGGNVGCDHVQNRDQSPWQWGSNMNSDDSFKKNATFEKNEIILYCIYIILYMYTEKICRQKK